MVISLESNDFLKKIEAGIVQYNVESVKSALGCLRDSEPEILIGALMKGIEKIRQSFKEETCSTPEFLLAIDAFKAGISFLKEIRPDFSMEKKEAGILIGVVEDDVHDLGKNMVVAVLEAFGYPVVDLGREVTVDMFLEGIKRHKTSVVGLSSMMSTSLENMKRVIRNVRRVAPQVRILVGGASLNREIAMHIGSDGYADSAVTAPEEIERILLLL